MFQHCAAIICSSSASADTFLRNLVDEAGFGRVSSYEARWPDTPVTFFLIHDGVAENERKETIAAVRGSDAFRFSPMVVIGEEGRPSQLSATEYRQAGFDDFIVPAAGNIAFVRTLLESFIMEEQSYYSTPTYFGPDRRRWERQSTRPQVHVHAAAAYHLYRFKRDPLAGIKVIEHRIVASTEAPPQGFPPGARPSAVPPVKRHH